MNIRSFFALAVSLCCVFAMPSDRAFATDYLCQVKVLNSLQGAVIRQIVCQFYFDDGTQYYHDKDVNVSFGQAGYNDSNTNVKCTKRVSTVIRFTYGGQTHALSDDTGNAPSGYCRILVPYELAPAYMIEVKKLESAKTPTERLASRLKLRTVDPKTGNPVQRDWKVVEDFDKYVSELRANAKKE